MKDISAFLCSVSSHSYFLGVHPLLWKHMDGTGISAEMLIIMLKM
jgi:hypothetical protein